MKKKKVGLITYDETEVEQAEDIGEDQAKEVIVAIGSVNDSFSRIRWRVGMDDIGR